LLRDLFSMGDLQLTYFGTRAADDNWRTTPSPASQYTPCMLTA